MSAVVYVDEVRTCDVCKFEDHKPDVPASYDARTNTGQWANVCEPHFLTHTPGEVGTGKAQRLIVGAEPPRDRKAEALAAAEANDIEAFFDAIGDGDVADFL